jgi:cation transport regulator ChaC
MKLYYFAYGSNMCTGRLRIRVPSARPLFVARLRGYALRFHKRSTDGSGKADAEYTGNDSDSVWGVVFEIDATQKPNLDEAEGLGSGYDEKRINLNDSAGRTYNAWMYYASQSHKDARIRPYSWYLRFVVEGAKQHGLLAEYVALIASAESNEDQDQARDARNRNILCE